jgi:acetylornithine/succinyldiaminopimelate/putrescine aminotransferase
MISAMASRKVLIAFALNNFSVLRIEPALGISDEDLNRILDAVYDSAAEVSAIAATLK